MMPHLSPDEISQCVAGERTVEQERHLSECARCAGEVGEVERTLRLFCESAKCWSEHQFEERPSPRPRWRAAMAVAAVVGACAAVWLAAVWVRPSAPRRVSAVPETPFVEMPYVAPLAPYERSEVVRMEVSVAALEAAGLEVHARDTGAMVLADLLLGQDGRAHAVRLVSEKENFNGRKNQ
jgi:hypothetical protein